MNDFADIQRFHFVGIGGTGMSAIAEIMLLSGCTVSGSDLQGSAVIDRLRLLGARLSIGEHREANLGDAQAVVFSTAVAAENPELRGALERGLPVIHRAEMLARLMRFKRGITVTGTHGKTTTTSMIAWLLAEAGLDPTAVIGARLKAFGSNARLGKSDLLVAEADESDRSFLLLSPLYSVVTNIDLDHLDQYRDLSDLQGAFLEHMQKVSSQGAVIACLDDPNLRPLLKKVHHRVLTYGLKPEADFSARQIQTGALHSEYECVRKGEPLGRIELNVGGVHNVRNSLAAVSVGVLLDVPWGVMARSLRTFEGAERRLERKGERAGVWVMDDYGHHPVEIRATLNACRATGRRVVAVFQPHRYSRTQFLMKEFAQCFEEADCLYLLEVYPAGEKPIPGVDSQRLAQEIRRYRQVTQVGDREELVERLIRETRPGDLLLTLGAGDVWKVGETFLAKPD